MNLLKNLSRVTWLLVSVLTGIIIVVVGGLIVHLSLNYYDPDFSRGFLVGKESYFYEPPYFVAFYCHIIFSPVALIIGLFQLNQWLRKNYHKLHERFGLVYTFSILLFVAPSGVLMSIHALGGTPSMLSFFLLSILTWVVTYNAWKYAKSKQYRKHGIWMTRSYILISSAIVLRLSYFLLSYLTDMDFLLSYKISAWVSWILPLAIFEFVLLIIATKPQSRTSK